MSPLLDLIHRNAWNLTGLLINAATLVYLIRYAADTKRLAVDTQKLAANSQQQLTFSERPFVAMVSSYDEEMDACLVYAHNQGVGPALDVDATLFLGDGESPLFGVGCLPANGKFQFLIGARSKDLRRATLKYESMSGHRWRTEVVLSAGMPLSTTVIDDGASGESGRGQAP
jgi:hypothetical protein